MFDWEGGVEPKTWILYLSNSSSVRHLYREKHEGRRKKERERQETWNIELVTPQEGSEEGGDIDTRVEDLKDTRKDREVEHS